MAAIEGRGQDCLVRVLCKPKASRNRIVRVTDQHVEILLAAPPVDGRANDELRRFLSKISEIPYSRIVLDKGESSRHKVVRLVDIDVELVERMLHDAT